MKYFVTSIGYDKIEKSEIASNRMPHYILNDISHKNVLNFLTKRSFRNCKTNIEYAVALWADEKPLCCLVILPEHAMETIFITTFRAFF